MADFIDQAEELLRARHGQVMPEKDAFDDVFLGLSELQEVFSKARIDVLNIESVFSAIEIAVTLQRLGSRSAADIERLRTSLQTLILKTLEAKVEFPVSDGQIRPPQTYDHLVQKLKRMHNGSQPIDTSHISFLTFNYDIALDYALHFHRLKYSYGLSEPDEAGIPLLKLHGSVNWGLCSKCKTVLPYRFSDLQFPTAAHFAKVFHFDLGSNLKNISHCESPLSGPPVLVPPTWDKSGARSQVSTVWRKAARVLGAAESIIIVGYSMPDTDMFFRYLHALGVHSQARLKAFIVINPDETGEVENRFKSLIGPAVEPRFSYRVGLFENALDSIVSECMKW